MPAIQAQLAEWFGFQESDWEVFVLETLAANPALFATSMEKLTWAFPNEFRTLDANQPHLNEKDVAHTHLKSRTKYLRVRKNKEVYEELKQMARHSKYTATVQTRSRNASRATRGKTLSLVLFTSNSANNVDNNLANKNGSSIQSGFRFTYLTKLIAPTKSTPTKSTGTKSTRSTPIPKPPGIQVSATIKGSTQQKTLADVSSPAKLKLWLQRDLKTAPPRDAFPCVYLRWTAKSGDNSELIRVMNESEWDVYVADIKADNQSGTITVQVSSSVEVLQVCIC